MKIVFLGNHTVGVRTLRVIRERAELVGVVAHPADPEDGVRYESVAVEACRLGVPVLRGTGRSGELTRFIAALQPDLLWIADYRYLLPTAVLALPRFGAINLHPSLLPRYRGRAPVNWAILHGETQLGLTAHFVDEGMDSGDIVGQRVFELTRDEDVGDALEKLYPLYESLTADVVRALLRGDISRRVQDNSVATVFPRRTPEDGRIDWTRSAESVWNLVRAVAAPYPGAFTECGAGRLRIWKIRTARRLATTNTAPGEVVGVSTERGEITLACGDAAVVISRFELEGASMPRVGDRLGRAASALEKKAA